MYRNDRLDEIVNIIRDSHYISVHKLAALIHASEPTIRRDLSFLEQNGAIIRTRGGAMPVNNKGYLSFSIRQSMFSESDKKIASLAPSLIDEQMVVFLDGCPISRQIPYYLEKHSNITIVTNSPDMSQQLTRMGIKTYCVGGMLNAYGNMIHGGFAEDFIRNFYFDVAFFGCSSLNSDGVLCGFTDYGVSLIKALLPRAKKRVFLCSSNIINTNAPLVICPLQEIDVVLCDTNLPAEFQRMIGKNRG